MRQIGPTVQYVRQCFHQDRGGSIRPHAFGSEMAAEGARARHGAEQAEHVPRDGVQAHALRRLAFDEIEDALLL